jgi:hypothetical protein
LSAGWLRLAARGIDARGACGELPRQADEFFQNSFDMKTSIPPVLITPALVCFALVQHTQAVSPAPDGGYSGNNTAEGTSALFSLTSGTDNTALGFQALYHNTTGQYNTATGWRALYENTDGFSNTANGYAALLHNTFGFENTANGAQALTSNTTGAENTANGYNALYSNTIGRDNTANGDRALASNTTGNSNTAIGERALVQNTIGRLNTANGVEALFANTTGNGNTTLGYAAGSAITNASNVICIGWNVVGENVDNSCFIGNIFGATSSGGTAVHIDSAGRLGTITSSRRFKEEIKPMERASEALFALKPVTFRYKKGIDPQAIPQFGLVAEDVEAVNPDLVVRDKEGKPYSVRYDQVNAMLLNEFLKEHKVFVEEHRTVQELKKEVAELTAGLQKVSAQLEASKPAPQVVLNNQ